jgi:ubiquinone/menaquinone biosynthesis C-methylase UbiE
MSAPKIFELITPYYDLLTRFWLMGTYERARDMMLNEDTREFTVLDLCCGTGYICNRINAKKIVGLDQSERMLAFNAGVKKENKTLIKGDAYNLPFSTNVFDRIYCANAVHEFKDLPQVLEKCHQILNPGGKLILFDVHQPKNWFLSLITNTLVRYVREQGFMWIHTKEQWKKLLSETGFRIEELKTISRFFIFIKAAKM